MNTTPLVPKNAGHKFPCTICSLLMVSISTESHQNLSMFHVFVG